MTTKSAAPALGAPMLPARAWEPELPKSVDGGNLALDRFAIHLKKFEDDAHSAA